MKQLDNNRITGESSGSHKAKQKGNRTSVRVDVIRLASAPGGAKFAELKVDAYGKSYVSIFELGKLADLDGKVLFDWLADHGSTNIHA